MDSSEPSDSRTIAAKAPTYNPHPQPIEEQIPANDSLVTEVPISSPETGTVPPFRTNDSCKTSPEFRVRKT